MKSGYLLLQINSTSNINGKAYVSFYVIPEKMRNEFQENPQLVYKSLSCKELYSIESAEYDKNVKYHEDQASEVYHHYVSYKTSAMGVSQDVSDTH